MKRATKIATADTPVSEKAIYRTTASTADGTPIPTDKRIRWKS